jgi:chromosome segregation ATPase
MTDSAHSKAAAYERGMQEGLDLRDQLREEIASLRERLGDREQDLKILGDQLSQAVEALRRIASDDCMIETGGWIDTGAPQRIAQDTLDDLKCAASDEVENA